MKASVSSEPQPAATRFLYLDLLRIIACLAVIMCHVSADNWYTLNPSDFRWQVLNVYDSTVCFCVPAFFMISGACFLNPNKPLSMKALYKKYLLRIVIAYLFWSLAYAVKSYLTSGEVLPFSGALLYILQKTIDSHYHLWFLPVLAGMYILTPLLRQITQKPDLTRYFLILFLIFGISLPTLQQFDIPYTGIVQTVIVTEIVTGYAGYFVLGYWLHSRDFSKRFRLIAFALGLLGILACIVVSSIYSLKENEPVAMLYSYLGLTTFISAAAVFLFFKYHAPRWHWAVRFQRFIKNLSACTFGAYLVHDFFLSALYDSGLHSIAFNTIVAVPALTLAIFIMNIAVSWLIRRIPFIHRYIT